MADFVVRGTVQRLGRRRFCAVVSTSPAAEQTHLPVSVQTSMHAAELDAMAACASMIVTAKRAIRGRGDRVAEVDIDGP